LEKLIGGGGGFTGLATTAASPQFTLEIYNSVQKHVVRNWDGPDAKAFAGLYKSNWVCSAEVPLKNSKTSRGPCSGQDLSIFFNIFEIYLVRQSL
jgi:hypothetical protein